MRFTVGGETFELTREQVIAATKDAPIESIHKHVVEIEGQVFPPKQVFAAATGRERQSFTTQEAQRVLARLGFVCRRVGLTNDGAPSWMPTDGSEVDESIPVDRVPRDRVAGLEAAIGTMQAAVAGLQARVSALESR